MDEAPASVEFKSQDDPVVSVVMIFLNGERFIREAIQSVLDQTFQSLELLLCDDGSSDGSTRIAKEFVGRHPGRVRYLEHEGHINKGMSATRNLGIAHARGSFVAFIDCDDVWRPRKLAEQIQIMLEYPDVGMVCGAVNYWSSWEGGEDRHVPTGHVQDRPVPPPEAALALYPLGAASAPCPSDLLIRKSLFRSTGGFEEHFRGAYSLYEDQGFLAKLYLQGIVYFSSETWLDYRQHSDSCMAVVTRDGKYDAVRKYFLAWLSSYLQDNPGLASPAVKSALRHASWPYRHAIMQSCLRRLRNMRFRTRSAISRMVRSLGIGDAT